jgi:hypothetical protein
MILANPSKLRPLGKKRSGPVQSRRGTVWKRDGRPHPGQDRWTEARSSWEIVPPPDDAEETMYRISTQGEA